MNKKNIDRQQLTTFYRIDTKQKQQGGRLVKQKAYMCYGSHFFMTNEEVPEKHGTLTILL